MKRHFLLLAAYLWTIPVSAAAPEPATETATSADYTAIQAKLDANDYKGAIEELTALSKTDQSASLYNFLGYASRKDGQLQSAAFYYTKALTIDPAHKGALAYQGELFLQLKDQSAAKANLAKLMELCPDSCKERKELETALAAGM
jgi:tetratricopeptide (TPR) repeat protein